jgi:CRP-like cAMP-binding protein
MAEFNAMGHLTLHPANTTLLMEGQIPRGVYIACSGRSKLSVEARDGKTIILKIAGERQVLGPRAVVSRGPSLITVTTIELCQTKVVERDSFLRLIEHDSHATPRSHAQPCSPAVRRRSSHLCSFPGSRAGPATGNFA